MLHYQFGSCESDDSCIPTTLELTLDEFPYETGYSLICNNTKIWYEPPHSFLTGLGYAEATVDDETCIDPSVCCVFTIVDDAQVKDGLLTGGFELDYG